MGAGGRLCRDLAGGFDSRPLPRTFEPLALGLTRLGALVVNLSCAFVLAAYRDASGSLTKAAFLSARNDTIASVAIIAAGAVTLLIRRSPWPDLIVGFGIDWMNMDAAKEVLEPARKEHEAAA